MLVVAGALFGASYYLITKGPCDSPLTYRIGDFNAKFGLSKADFLQDIHDAERIWENAVGKNLFTYDPKGEMAINLIYDTRQATTDKNQVLSSNIDQTLSSAAPIKQQVDDLKQRYNAAKGEYDALLTEYQAKLSSYNNQVEYYNSQGGARGGEYATIQAERTDLVNLQNEVNAKMTEVNDLAHQVNAVIDSYNGLVRVANTDVSKINQTANREFEEGEYVSDSKGERINVYEFTNKAQLVRLLAHELGHSLGIDHNSNPQSIMYYLNKGTGLVPSSEDIASLKKACRIK